MAATPLDMASRHDLEDTFNAMRPHFEDKETEQNWQLREKDTAKLRRITIGNAPKVLKDTYQAGMKSLLEGVIKVINSLVSLLSLVVTTAPSSFCTVAMCSCCSNIIIWSQCLSATPISFHCRRVNPLTMSSLRRLSISLTQCHSTVMLPCSLSHRCPTIATLADSTPGRELHYLPADVTSSKTWPKKRHQAWITPPRLFFHIS